MGINSVSPLPQRRPLPVIILADVSTSMEGGKIRALNQSLIDMQTKFSELHDTRGHIHLGIVTFATNAKQILTVTPIEKVVLPSLPASGMTAMGEAFKVVSGILEDEQQLPKNAWAPTIVLVSDGQPNDDWEETLDQLLSSPKGKKAVRLAVGIGSDCDFQILKRFINHSEVPVMRANEVEKLADFFRFVTYSVMARSTARDPNAMHLPLHLLEEDDLDF